MNADSITGWLVDDLPKMVVNIPKSSELKFTGITVGIIFSLLFYLHVDVDPVKLKGLDLHPLAKVSGGHVKCLAFFSNHNG